MLERISSMAKDLRIPKDFDGTRGLYSIFSLVPPKTMQKPSVNLKTEIPEDDSNAAKFLMGSVDKNDLSSYYEERLEGTDTS